MKNFLANYHTHSHYCDGKEAPEEYIKKAIEFGFSALGFSSHAPIHFENDYSISIERLKDYCLEIEELKKKYSEHLAVFLALEADYIPKKTYEFDFFRKEYQLDYIIGSIHLVAHPNTGDLWFVDGGKSELWDHGFREVFEEDIVKGVKSFFHQTNEMIESQKPEILGHFDKIKMHNKNRFFSPDDSWYKKLIIESLHLFREKNTILEINTRGLYKGRYDELFPSISILQQAQTLGIPLMLNTDAHHPAELNGHYNETIQELKKAGIKELWHYSKKGWFSSTID